MVSNIVQHSNWEILLGASNGENWISVLAPNQKAFDQEITTLFPELKSLARNISIWVGTQKGERFLISSKTNKYLLESQMLLDQITVINDHLFVNSNSLDLLDTQLIKVAEKLIMLGQDKIPSALTITNSAITPNLQAWVNTPTAQLFEARGQDLTKVDTAKYWHPQDLSDFYTELKDISPGRDLTFKYRAQGKLDDPDYWLEITNQYTIIEALNQRFRISKVLDAKEIQKPVIA